MPLQNRVTPTSEIITDAARGTVMGNRGILHDRRRLFGAARWRHPHWICCRLSFKDRRREVMAPRRYTELFFLDEATALAAGHRPCCECRREDFRRFQAAWRCAFGATAEASARTLDRTLHEASVDSRTRRQIRFETLLDDLPDGAFVLLADDPGASLLILGDRLLPWHSVGYGQARPRRSATRCIVLTPCPTVAVLRAGYAPALHPSVTRARGCAGPVDLPLGPRGWAWRRPQQRG
jgi:hypothetical protein